MNYFCSNIHVFLCLWPMAYWILNVTIEHKQITYIFRCSQHLAIFYYAESRAPCLRYNNIWHLLFSSYLRMRSSFHLTFISLTQNEPFKVTQRSLSLELKPFVNLATRDTLDISEGTDDDKLFWRSWLVSSMANFAPLTITYSGRG